MYVLHPTVLIRREGGVSKSWVVQGHALLQCQVMLSYSTMGLAQDQLNHCIPRTLLVGAGGLKAGFGGECAAQQRNTSGGESCCHTSTWALAQDQV
jgi:hypothetical protein